MLCQPARDSAGLAVLFAVRSFLECYYITTLRGSLSNARGNRHACLFLVCVAHLYLYLVFDILHCCFVGS